ncbi:MAG: hypothetical protein PHI59_05400 [Candidatus Omnitrophica bacterium]|nr:hypothetical protein [Candidatus Omnitrophota bacterium]
MHVSKKLNKRQEEVLRIIVNSHVHSAMPVGSTCVADILGLSSATIRNVMAELEELGFIMHPHTSAGRVPTDEGYRYYIDSLMQVKDLSGNIMGSIEENYHQGVNSAEDAMERTSSLISDLTKYVGITVVTQFEKVYLDGTSHILEQPEFRDFKKLYAIFRCFEDRDIILHILCGETDEGKLAISVGRENKLGYLQDCSIVSRGYKKRGKVSGRLGVIGPKRMVYERVVPMVDFLATMLSEVLDEIDGR